MKYTVLKNVHETSRPFFDRTIAPFHFEKYTDFYIRERFIKSFIIEPHAYVGITQYACEEHKIGIARLSYMPQMQNYDMSFDNKFHLIEAYVPTIKDEKLGNKWRCAPHEVVGYNDAGALNEIYISDKIAEFDSRLVLGLNDKFDPYWDSDFAEIVSRTIDYNRAVKSMRNHFVSSKAIIQKPPLRIVSKNSVEFEGLLYSKKTSNFYTGWRGYIRGLMNGNANIQLDTIKSALQCVGSINYSGNVIPKIISEARYDINDADMHVNAESYYKSNTDYHDYRLDVSAERPVRLTHKQILEIKQREFYASATGFGMF